MRKKLITNCIILVKQEVTATQTTANNKSIPNIKKVKNEIIIIPELVDSLFYY